MWSYAELLNHLLSVSLKRKDMERFALKIGNFVLETTRVVPVVLSIIVIALSVLGYQIMRSGALNTIEIQQSAVISTIDKELVS